MKNERCFYTRNSTIAFSPKKKRQWCRFLFIIHFSFLILSLLGSCGKDRTYEYEEKTACDHWILSAMQDNYIWRDSIKIDKLDWKDYFAKPATFFSKLTAFAPITDDYSWCEIDTINEDHHIRGYFNHLDSYGIDFVVMTDPTGATSRQYARVITVFPDSPAQRCGLKRGDFIGSIDNTRFTTSHTKDLVNGPSHTLIVSKLGINSEVFIWTSTDTLIIESSQYVEDHAFPIYNTFDTSYGKVCYLMCNRLTEGPTERNSNSNVYREEMLGYLSKMKEENPYALILDLRLCNDGNLNMARTLASYLVNDVDDASVFAKTLYHNSRSELNSEYTYESEGLSNNLGLKELVFITSHYTKGAAEWLIRGITASMGEEYVSRYGTTTDGQIVITETIKSSHYVTLHPAVAFVADGRGSYDYISGIEPTVEFDEMTFPFLNPYGDESEIVLSVILQELGYNSR